MKKIQEIRRYLMPVKPGRRTLRESVILLLAALGVILLCTFALHTSVNAKRAQASLRDTRDTRVTYESVRILSGDTLWSIAREYCGTGNTADFVEDLKVLNSLSSDHIQAGCYILVPVSSMR